MTRGDVTQLEVPPDEHRLTATSPAPPGEGGRVVLADGTVVDVRPISPDDVDDLIAFHEDLSFETVYRRFFGVHPHLGSAEATHFCVLDDPGRFALVARCGSELIGVARMERSESPTTAEVAFVVADRYQDRGLGRVLAQRLADAARRRGMTELVAEVLADNRPMLHLLPDAGLEITVSYSHGVAQLRCPIGS